MSGGPQLSNIGADHRGVDLDTTLPHASGWEIPVRVRVRVYHDGDSMAAHVERIVARGDFKAAAFGDSDFEIRGGTDVYDGIDPQMRDLLEALAIEEWCREEEPIEADMRRGA